MMLRIQKTCNDCGVVIQISGRLSAAYLHELSNQIEGSAASIALDLGELTLIDLESVQFLARCETEGAELRHCPAYIREWISRERDCPDNSR